MGIEFLIKGKNLYMFKGRLFHQMFLIRNVLLYLHNNFYSFLIKLRIMKNPIWFSLVLIFLLSPVFRLAYTQPDFPVSPEDPDEGFVSIFNGEDLEGWDGDPVYWRVEDGKIIGEITPETIVDRNTFLIWREDQPSDFELKMEYRITEDGNSGINYRSEEVDGVSWALKGYQADIDGKGQWNGQNYEERGRTFLALRGQITRVEEKKKPEIIGSTGDKDVLQSFINKEDWNEYHLIIRDNTLIHMINDHVMSIVVDDDKENRTREGLIGVQVHVGPPMKVEYRNIRIKNLD